MGWEGRPAAAAKFVAAAAAAVGVLARDCGCVVRADHSFRFFEVRTAA